MAMTTELVVIDSREAPAASCVVCGNDVPAGEGIAAQYLGQSLRFKCPGCYARFEADPARFLSGDPGGCCKGDEHLSPASEWRCD